MLKNRKLVLIITTILMVTMAGVVLAQDSKMNRENIADEYKWNFSDIYPDYDTWEKGFTDLEKMMDEIAGLKGTLAQGANQLLKAQQMQDEMNILAFKVYRYPQLMRDTDTRNQEVSAKLQKVQILFAKFGTATSWIDPEILQIPWETMKKWLDETPGLAPYRFGIEDLYRQQKHVLSEDKEKMLSYYSQFRGTPRDVYSEMSTSDIKFPEIELADGSKNKITRGNYSKILATNPNQADRKTAFEAHYTVFNDYKNTYAAIYKGVCQKDWANAQSRNYSSCLEAALEGNNIPIDVYKNLVKAVKENTAPLQRYIKLRKKALGLEEYHGYDGSIPLVDFNKEYEYEEAKELVYKSIKPLGKDYQRKIKTAMQGGWIDVFENDGKRSGAYSAGVYGVHPYMLLNYNKTLDYVFTLGHELGHTMHTLLASETQPFATHGYTIFVAEVASTFNERLLLDYMLKKTKDPKERIALIQQAISNITGTLYFQTLLADFEMQVHEMVEQGRPITAQVLDGLMDELFTTYYGDATVKDELMNVVWARIPHIYRTPYYVYQYATCFVSSAKLYEDVTIGSKKEKKAATEKYLNLLKSGGNDYPMEQLKKAGVDLTRPETMKAVFTQFDKLVTMLEKELAKLK